MKTFSIDQDSSESTLEDILEVNELSEEEIELLNTMKVGEKAFIGMCEVERIS